MCVPSPGLLFPDTSQCFSADLHLEPALLEHSAITPKCYTGPPYIRRHHSTPRQGTWCSAPHFQAYFSGCLRSEIRRQSNKDNTIQRCEISMEQISDKLYRGMEEGRHKVWISVWFSCHFQPPHTSLLPARTITVCDFIVKNQFKIR